MASVTPDHPSYRASLSLGRYQIIQLGCEESAQSCYLIVSQLGVEPQLLDRKSDAITIEIMSRDLRSFEI